MIARLNCVTDEAQRRFRAGTRPGWPLTLRDSGSDRNGEDPQGAECEASQSGGASRIAQKARRIQEQGQ